MQVCSSRFEITDRISPGVNFFMASKQNDTDSCLTAFLHSHNLSLLFGLMWPFSDAQFYFQDHNI